MNLQQRIDALVSLGEYMLSKDDNWEAAKERGSRMNGWFIPEFIELSVEAIAKQYLARPVLEQWAASYTIPEENTNPRKVGIVMAGNIPLVGFHDLLCCFITGHIAIIKPSSKDDVLIRHLVQRLVEHDAAAATYFEFAEMLKGCDAYIATGSNNSAGYFDYYFGKYPNLIRRNRTSVAILTGNESKEELDRLTDDIFLYFGMGCRNVTKLYVPKEYDFVPFLRAGDKYRHLADHHKYKNNYDYNLALLLLNKQFYMSNEALLLAENPSIFSPISQLNYEFYTDKNKVEESLKNNKDVQCIVGQGFIPFGKAQQPGITDYADGADTLRFLLEL